MKQNYLKEKQLLQLLRQTKKNLYKWKARTNIWWIYPEIYVKYWMTTTTYQKSVSSKNKNRLYLCAFDPIDAVRPNEIPMVGQCYCCWPCSVWKGYICTNWLGWLINCNNFSQLRNLKKRKKETLTKFYEQNIVIKIEWAHISNV